MYTYTDIIYMYIHNMYIHIQQIPAINPSCWTFLHQLNVKPSLRHHLSFSSRKTQVIIKLKLSILHWKVLRWNVASCNLTVCSWPWPSRNTGFSRKKCDFPQSSSPNLRMTHLDRLVCCQIPLFQDVLVPDIADQIMCCVFECWHLAVHEKCQVKKCGKWG